MRADSISSPPSTSWPSQVLCGFSVSVYLKLGASILSSGSYNIPASALFHTQRFWKKLGVGWSQVISVFRNLPSYSNKELGLEATELYHIAHRVATPRCLSFIWITWVTGDKRSCHLCRRQTGGRLVLIFSMNVSHIRHSTGDFRPTLTFFFFYSNSSILRCFKSMFR